MKNNLAWPRCLEIFYLGCHSLLQSFPESSSSSQGISQGWAVSADNDVASDSRCRTTCLFQASGFLLYFDKSIQFSSVQSLSRVRLFETPWITACQASLSIINSQSSLRLTSIESVISSSHLILGRPLLLLPPIPPSISLFQWVNSSHGMAKVLEFQL